MKYPEITVKGAVITKHKNPFYPEEHYDYTLRLDEKMYNKWKDMGLNVKMIHNDITDQDVYFINVTPVSEPDFYNLYKRIPAPSDDEFLNRNDVDVTFRVYVREINDRTITKLYFSKSGIKEVKGETK